MNNSIIIGLLQNTAILLAISFIYDYWWVKSDTPRKSLNKIMTGLVIGLIGVVLMLTPWIYIPGIVFDTRSVVLSVSGLFFGPIPTIIAMLITGIFRYSLGGDGVWMGIAVIFFSGTIGILWNRFRPIQKTSNYLIELLVMGLVVHVVMLGCTMLLPSGLTINILKTITIPLFIIYPVATVLLGSLMFRQYENWQNRKASEKLLESERRFSELMKNTALFSAILDIEGKIIYCNKSLLTSSGYTNEELLGKNFFEIFIEDYEKKDILNVFRSILEVNESNLNFENTIKLKEGGNLMVSWNNTVLRDTDSKVIGVASIGENITERKKTEAELISEKIKAEENDKLKSIFLANMSHEIRTPMNAIMGFSGLLIEHNVDEDDKIQYLEIIRNSSNRLFQLINDIIDLSKIEARQLTINNSVCNLSDILTNSIELFRKSELLQKKPELELVLKLQHEYKKINFFSDCLRVQQVLENLISNAIKYTSKGTIEVGCSLKTEDSGEVIEIYVKDSGIGISEAMSTLVFERFRQVEEAQYHEGAGLGLSISKGILDLLGGKIWFKSKINVGTTFFFSIPYIKSEEKTGHTIRTKEVIPELHGMNIIIAEDDYNSFRYLQLVLGGQNANISHADNGLKLMEMIRIQIPDLIFLDINMPVMSGFEVLSAMRKEGLATRIIAQTAYAMPTEKEKCLKEGCNGYISKPIKKAELFEVINTVIST